MKKKNEYNRLAKELWNSSSSGTESYGSSGSENSDVEEQGSGEVIQHDSSTSKGAEPKPKPKPKPDIPPLGFNKLTHTAAAHVLSQESQIPASKKSDASSPDSSDEALPTQSPKPSPGSSGSE